MPQSWRSFRQLLLLAIPHIIPKSPAIGVRSALILMPLVISLVIQILGQIAGVVVHHLMTRIGITWAIYLYKAISKMFVLRQKRPQTAPTGILGIRLGSRLGKSIKRIATATSNSSAPGHSILMKTSTCWAA